MPTQPKERPILFSGDMIKAILENRKSQTRRVIKPQPVISAPVVYNWHESRGVWRNYHDPGARFRCPYGVPGDRLWVRETWKTASQYDDLPPSRLPCHAFEKGQDIVYAADAEDSYSLSGRLRPSIHMPRWASRITLEVMGVRVERVQEISEEDAKAEGINPIYDKDMYCDERDLTHIHGTGGFIDLWDSINAARGYPWADNPWVWVVEFIAASKIGA